MPTQQPLLTALICKLVALYSEHDYSRTGIDEGSLMTTSGRESRDQCYKVELVSRLTIDSQQHQHSNTLVDTHQKFNMFRNMQLTLFTSILFCGATTLVHASSPLPNIRATYGSSPAPFTIDVEPRFIDDVRQRVNNARSPVPPGGYEPAYSEGPP